MCVDHFGNKFSVKELFDISQEIGKNFSPIFETPVVSGTAIKLSSSELLDISEEISRSFTTGYAPAQTNQLVLLPIDPDHLYAYWHGLDLDVDNDTQATAVEKPTLTLRVYDQRQQEPSESAGLHHDIPLHANQAEYTISLPSITASGAYSAAIGAQDSDGHFVSLVQSNTVKTYPNPSASYYSMNNLADTLIPAPFQRQVFSASGLGFQSR